MEFRQFDEASYQATLKKWREEAETYDCFPEEVERKLHWIHCSLTSNKQEQHEVIPYGVFVGDSNIAAATCELVLSHRGQMNGKWLKMLKVTLSPEIESLSQEDNYDAIATAVSAYRAATVGAYNARLSHAADTLKLFGRDNDQLKFLMTLMSFIKEDPENSSLVASKEGRWLVLRSAT